MSPIEKAIQVLNELHHLDPSVMQALVYHRVPCNSYVAEHPSIQVGMEEDGSFHVGILGIINGLFGVQENDQGYISANVNPETGEIWYFAENLNKEKFETETSRPYKKGSS